MRTLIVCALLAVASAQLFGNRLLPSHHGGYTFGYHSRHDVLIIRDRQNCYIIGADKATIGAYKDDNMRTAVEDDIIKHIKDRAGLHQERPWELLTHFHDPLAAAECITRKTFELDYKLPASFGSKASTQMPSQTVTA